VTPSGVSSAVVVSTLMEAWQILASGLVDEGVVNDVSFQNRSSAPSNPILPFLQILYGLPIGTRKIAEVAQLAKELQKRKSLLRLFVDHPDHINALHEFNQKHSDQPPWSVFVKVDAGGQ
jgi:D-serine ammonia-lyase